jgi:hypothetical protein
MGLPSQQHLSVFGDLVLPLIGGGQVVRIDVFQAHRRAWTAFDMTGRYLFLLVDF